MRNTTAAALGLVTKTEFKRAIHMEESDTEDDALLDALLASATAVVDTGTGHPMAAAVYEFDAPVGDWRCWWFPVRPVNTLTSVEWMDESGAWLGDGTGGAYVLGGHDEPRLILPDDLRQSMCSAQEIRVTADVGGAPTEQQRQAVILTVKEWRDAGISFEAIGASKLSFHIRDLIDQVRYRRPAVVA